MTILNPGPTTNDPWETLKTFIETNMISPDGVWTPVVNPGWLLSKKQKTYQISMKPLIQQNREAQLTGGSSTNTPMEAVLFIIVTLYAPTRAKRWELYRAFKVPFDNGTLTCPLTAAGTFAGVGGSDIHYIRIDRSEETKALRWADDECGPGATGDCTGYRTDITIQMRWNE